MKRDIISFVGVFLFSILLFACTSEKKSSDKSTTPTSASAQSSLLSIGENVYMANCMACHMKNGEGLAGLYPPLTKTKYTLGEKEQLINIVINGMSGEIEVLGTTYNSVMTPFGYLSDEEIAAVLSYIRQSFGNDAEMISAADVAAVR